MRRWVQLPGWRFGWFGGWACATRGHEARHATYRSPLIADVHAFPGHIACDAASRSELVVRLMARDDVPGIEQIAALYVAAGDRP